MVLKIVWLPTRYVLCPVGLGALLLTMTAIVCNNVFASRPYPLLVKSADKPPPLPVLARGA